MPDAYGELAAGIAAARERFLAAGEAVAGTVREQILNSWRRSRFSSVDVDRIDPPYRADIDYDNRLVRSAGPVLDRLERELSEEPMTVVLTDPEAGSRDAPPAIARCNASWTRFPWRLASATPRSSSAPTASAPRSRTSRAPGSTARSTSPRASRRCRAPAPSSATPCAGVWRASST